MRRNQILLIVLMVVTAVLTSIRGGTITYTLFYFVWGAPILSGLYLLYVYVRFRIYQDIERRTLVKGEKVPYTFQLSNHDIITYTSVRVRFFDRLSGIEGIEQNKNYSFTPGQSYKKETIICVKYRGEYSVGVDRAEIMDFLHLFKMTYRYPKSIMVTVLPIIPHYENLAVAVEEYAENINVNSARHEESYPDVELRKYITGDSIRAVNWKASARGRELFTRKYIDETNPAVLLLADFSSTGLNGEDKILIEDKLIEANLGIADYLYRKNVTIDTLFCDDEIKVLPIYSKAGMDNFYNICAKNSFNARLGAPELLYERGRGAYVQVIIVTHKISEELMKVAVGIASKGRLINIVHIGDDSLTDRMWEDNTGVRITHILSEQEVGDVLDRKV
ncbi:MAG: DUF58 domain-containing protein [Lachnospiraceae bacterium]|nr:DUF58 domain-containing protein [Lachnospiraceae bacterium]